MEGIAYLTDDKNEKIAVQIDLKKHGELWEDFYDLLTVKERQSEESLDWDEVEKQLQEKGLL